MIMELTTRPFPASSSAGPTTATMNMVKPKGGSPALVVMGGDSCPKGHEFESQHRILDGHFFSYVFAVKFVMCA